MLPIFARAVSGMQTMQQAMDITSDNISNANTPGFDATIPTIDDLVYQQMDARSLVSNTDTTTLGIGAHIDGTPRSQKPGAPMLTGNPLDVAITGDGYLQVLMPDGTTGYSRRGDIRIDAQGRLNIEGHLLLPPITIPTGASNLTISQDGQIATNGGTQVIGQIQLARFTNPQGLAALGSTVYGQTVASGAPEVGNPAQNGFGGILSGALEASRVDMAREMVNLVISERGFQLNARTLQTIDSMIGEVTHR